MTRASPASLPSGRKVRKLLLILACFFLAPEAFPQDFEQLVKTGTPEEVQEAISNGADVEATDFPFWSVKQFRSEVAHQYQNETEGLTPLMLAAAFNQNPEVISVLLKAGAKIDDRDNEGGTPLMWAAEYNSNPLVVSALLRRGKDR